MNSLREKLIRFFTYIKDYNFINTFILTLYSIGLLWFILPVSFFEYLLLMLVFLAPIFIVHIIEPKEYIPQIDYSSCSSWFKKIILFIKTMFRHYIIKYLKSYVLFLIVFLFAVLLICSSSVISIAVLINSMEQSLGLSLILLLSTFLMLEGFTLLLTLMPFWVTMIVENLNPINSIFRCKKILKKQLLKHFFIVVTFSILALPIAFLSDYLNKFTYLVMVLRLAYFMIVINFTIFDVKERISIYRNENMPKEIKSIVQSKHKSKKKTKSTKKSRK